MQGKSLLLGDVTLKNNITISGVPRAGKSTISHIISKKFGYQHVSMDSINAGFEKVFPELGIDTSADMPYLEKLRNISAKIAPFIKAMMDSGEYDEFKPGMVLDVYQLLPEDYIKYLYHGNCEIFYFIASETTPEERFTLLKTYDTEKDYTFYKPEDELREVCAEIVDVSKFIKEQCIKYNLPYYETAKNEKQYLNSLFNCFQQTAIYEYSYIPYFKIIIP